MISLFVPIPQISRIGRSECLSAIPHRSVSGDGLIGIRALAGNMFDGRHPSQMARTAGSGESAALYVMPYFFANKIPPRKMVRFIWPEDGSLASPITLLVQKKKSKTLKPIIDFLNGKQLAKIFVDAHYPSPHPGIRNNLPATPGLKWLGWDFIHANDLGRINDEIDAVFLPAVPAGDGS